MAKKVTAKVQRFGARDCYAKKIGKHRGDDGAIRPKVWYFQTASEEDAIAQSLAIKAEWRTIYKADPGFWPSDYMPPHKRPGLRLTAANGQAHPTAPEAPRGRYVPPLAVTLADCLKVYKAHLEQRTQRPIDGKPQISHARARNAHNFAKRSVDHLGGTTRLADVDRAALVALVDWWCSRPESAKGEPMAEESVKSHVSAAGTFFRWIADQDGTGWALPDRFDSIWGVHSLKPKTEAERRAKYNAKRDKGGLTIGTKELRVLYTAADDQMKAWILLGLNCAFQAVDISNLRQYEIEADGKRTIIDRDREKTGVRGRWAIWPETRKAIRKAQTTANEEERVFLTPRGNPLVSEKTRSDYVSDKWEALRTAAKLKDVPGFKFLRKTSADAIKQLSGSDEISRLHRCHDEQNRMAKPYTDRLFGELFKWQDELRKHFAEVWR
jgi:hypothetical protein